MSTEMHTFKGTLSWVKIQNPDEYLGVKKWKVNITLNQEELQKYQASGCRVQPKRGTDNEFSFSKPCVAPEWHDANKHPAWEAPKVMHNNLNFDGLVGNDSEGEVTIQVYDTRMGKGHRLESINITNLVGYEPDNEEGNSPEPSTETKEESKKEPW